ncbi:hypothetical protein SPRG_11732 [Saprolegnia parasitica CBS 223.65]|uniref:Uncharacterized protein n=1 Tax=Saprolegnia parasitica (strain CBS 223.65) TaxID=695850 RepID=A0A067C0A6_SAPPC|nr:hypothetical protein SPRG_11732 [Saprolegnia parasitica CBS 223.65]KDO22550.1 hypothetical protein SPRG_11732 [Saprolegnia parasitica CBS 223.65]|eukprot:XP_012206796.1 hypothetical protein SPRG_11732 [Saprolegnia parasitica CBS 223.65]
MRFCADKLRGSKHALIDALEAMRDEELPVVKFKHKLLYEAHEKEEDIRERNLKKFEALEKQAHEMLDKMLAEKKQLETEMRRQSQQFRNVMDQRDADVEAEYSKALGQLHDELEDTTQQLELAIRIRDAKHAHLTDLPAPSTDLDELVATNAALKAQVEDANEDVAALKDEYHALKNAPIKRKPQDELVSAKSRALAEKKDAMECVHLQQEIRVLQQTHQTMQNKSTQRHWLELQVQENKRVEEAIANVAAEIEATKTNLVQTSIRLQSLLRTLASSPTVGAVMTRLYGLFSATNVTLSVAECLAASPSEPEGRQALLELEQMGLIRRESDFITKI